MQFRDKTAYVLGLCYWWDPSLLIRSFAIDEGALHTFCHPGWMIDYRWYIHPQIILFFFMTIMKALFHEKKRPHFPKIDILRLKFCQDFEAEVLSRFWGWILNKIFRLKYFDILKMILFNLSRFEIREKCITQERSKESQGGPCKSRTLSLSPERHRFLLGQCCGVEYESVDELQVPLLNPSPRQISGAGWVIDVCLCQVMVRRSKTRSRRFLSDQSQWQVKTGSSVMIVARKKLFAITTSLMLVALSLYSTTKNYDNVTNVGLDDLPTIKPLDCVQTKRILEGKYF